MSAEFSGGYRSIRGQSGGNQDDNRSSGGYQSEDHVIFQALSDSISGNIFQVNGNVQALESIYKQLGNQLTEVPYDKLLCILQGTNKLESDTTVCLKRMVSLQGGSVPERRKQRRMLEILNGEFENSTSKYRNVQKKLTERSKQVMMNSTAVKHRSQRGQPANGFEIDDNKTRLLSDQQESQQQQQQVEDSASFVESMLKESERMIRQLEASIAPVVENQNSMGGEEMDLDSNNNHDQAAFPQAGGFNFTAPTTGNTSGLFPAGTSGTLGGNTGSFHFNGGGMTSSFPFGNSSTPSSGFNFAASQTGGPSPFAFGVTSTPANGPTNTSSAASLFNFGGSTANLAVKPQLIVSQTSEQPALFNIGASQTPPSNRVIKKAVRRSRPK